MKVPDNLPPLGPADSSRSQAPDRPGEASRVQGRTADRNSTNAVSADPLFDDSVQLSSLAQSVRELAADSPERQYRIHELQSQIDSGRYQVDASETADQIINDAIAGRADGIRDVDGSES